MADTINAVMRSEILDEDTCDVCYNELDGIIMRPDDPRWPELSALAHANCRMVLVPIASDLEHLVEPTPDEIIEGIRSHFGRLIPFSEVERLRSVRAAAPLPEITVEEVLELVDWEDFRWLLLRHLEGG